MKIGHILKTKREKENIGNFTNSDSKGLIARIKLFLHSISHPSNYFVFLHKRLIESDQIVSNRLHQVDSRLEVAVREGGQSLEERGTERPVHLRIPTGTTRSGLDNQIGNPVCPRHLLYIKMKIHFLRHDITDILSFFFV